jgi:hypothetical protein
MTCTIGVDADQYQELCEAAQADGRAVSEIINEALNEWISASTKAPESEAKQA